ncbi:Rv3654c family TadE-like protein [Actinophytocola sp.]|uniref:Rv3654c family TadE-like protein n=1 Tax=Actinophytocola sp. TaxID=1872138 RepID=UPI00389A3E6F
MSGSDRRGRQLYGGVVPVPGHWSADFLGVGGWRGKALQPFNRSPSYGCDERFGDRGAATVWTAGVVAAVAVLTVWLLWFVSAVVTRHRAESAADLAALAAATKAVAGERAACDEARWVAGQMGVELRSCRLSGWDALVEVVAAPPGVLSRLRPAVARARAGPVEQDAEASSTVAHER